MKSEQPTNTWSRLVVLSVWVFLATGAVNVLSPGLSLSQRVAATILLVGLRSAR